MGSERTNKGLGTAAGVGTGGATFPLEVAVAAAEAEDVEVGVEEMLLSVSEAIARGFPEEERLMEASTVATAVSAAVDVTSPASCPCCSSSCLPHRALVRFLVDGVGRREGYEWEDCCREGCPPRPRSSLSSSSLCSCSSFVAGHSRGSRKGSWMGIVPGERRDGGFRE